ncbi:hypothetical protein [Methylobacter sp.]|uniref:hypothetical protein n=1 Tax=Methylobacter sp. TaxID=2051955 RepID=UPI003DA1EC38
MAIHQQIKERGQVLRYHILLRFLENVSKNVVLQDLTPFFLMSKYRGRGQELQAELDAIISQQDYVYRATNMRTVDIYRHNGVISGRSGGTYMTTDFVGLDPKVLMDRGQVFPAWGEPEVLLRIPTSALDNAVVPRPLGESLSAGWEPFTEFYPAAGSGGIRQFMGTTKTWSDDWIIPLKQD